MDQTRDAYGRFGALLEWQGDKPTMAGEILRAVDTLWQGFRTCDATVYDQLGTIDRFFCWLGHKYITGQGLPKDEDAGYRMIYFCSFLGSVPGIRSTYDHDCYLAYLDQAVLEIVDFLPDHPELADTPCRVSCWDFWEPQDEPMDLGFGDLQQRYADLYWGGEKL